MNNRRWSIVAVMALFAIGITTAACGGDDAEGIAASTTVPASISITTVPPSTSTTTSITTVPPSTSTTTVSQPTTTTRAAVPGAVEVVTAGAGGGSGEISLRWNAVANATGYRVLRANAASGPFSVNAAIDITTGKATAATDVTNIRSLQHSYVPSGATAPAPDPSPWFEYVEVVTGGAVQRYFRVVAFNANGDAPASVVVCGSPNGYPSC